MGAAQSSMHVANVSSQYIKVRVAQEKVHLTEIEGGLGGELGMLPWKADMKMKASLQYSLDGIGFGRIGPREALEFNLPRGKNAEVFVTIAEDTCKEFYYYNYNPPSGYSVIFKETCTLMLCRQPTKKELRKKGLLTSTPQLPSTYINFNNNEDLLFTPNQYRLGISRNSVSEIISISSHDHISGATGFTMSSDDLPEENWGRERAIEYSSKIFSEGKSRERPNLESGHARIKRRAQNMDDTGGTSYVTSECIVDSADPPAKIKVTKQSTSDTDNNSLIICSNDIGLKSEEDYQVLKDGQEEDNDEEEEIDDNGVEDLEGEAIWMTTDGFYYSARMATKIYRQSDIDRSIAEYLNDVQNG